MTVKDAMSPGVHVINPEATIQDAAELMKVANVGSLPVVEHGQVLGVVTDRDLVTRCLVDGFPRNAQVREAMTVHAIVVSEQETLDKALETMTEHKVARIYAKDYMGHLSGVLSATDLAAVFNGHHGVGKLLAALKEAHKSKSRDFVARLL